MEITNSAKRPSLVLSLIPIVVMVVLLFFTIHIFGSDALSGGSQVVLLLTTACCSALAMGFCRVKWKKIEEAICTNILGIATALLILLLIGALSGSWMISGVVPTLIYYGMQVLSPTFFLASSCIICAIVSVMTGSSWTTIATIGVALMGIGEALGFSTGWTAGAIISGAYFGDKISPLSDTTVLASSTTNTPLFTHIRYMMYTTVPTMLITLIIFTVAGFTFDHANASQAMSFAASLKETFHISAVLMIVPVVTGILIAKRVAPLITLFISALLAAVFALLFQPNLYVQRRIHNIVRIDTTGNRKRDVEFLSLNTRHGRYDEYHLVNNMRHVLWWSHDSQRHAGNNYVGLYALYETSCRHGSVDRIFGPDTEYLYSRSVHIHHPDRKYVQGNLSEERIRKSPAEPHNRRCRDRNIRLDSVEYLRYDASHYIKCTNINIPSILLF